MQKTLRLVVLALCLVFSFAGFGQASYLGLDGGLEGTATIDNTNVYTGAQTGLWSKNNATTTLANETTIVRSGANSLRVQNSSTTGRRIWAPNMAVSTSLAVTIQYYRYVAATTAQESQEGVNRNGTESLSGTYGNGTAGTWTKVTYSPTGTTATANALWAVIMTRVPASGTAGNMYIDDVCVYTGGVDNTAPNVPGGTTATVAQNGTNPSTALDVSWSAASGGVDGGGYIVVRGITDPTTAPNANGIYATGNTIGSGTVVYVGTGTSFTDAGRSASTTYYYRVYTFDKAYNYSSAILGNGATAAASAPVLSITTPSAISSGGTYGFGNQISGTSSTPVTFTIKNTGASVLSLTGVTLTGTNNTEFSVNTSGMSSSLAPSATTTFTGTFSPNTDGAKSATINIANNSSTNPFLINVTGTGTASAASDIVTAGGEATDILYANTTGTITTTATATKVWSFTVRDGGAAADADNLSTILSAVTIGQGASNNIANWATYINKAALFNGSTKVADLTVNSTSLTVTGMSGANVTAADGGTLTLDLYLTFNTSNIVDRKQFQFQIASAGATAAASGSSTFGSFTTASSSSASTANLIQVVASKLVFTTNPPASGFSNTNLSSSPAVTAEDANNNIDINFTYPGLSVTNSAGMGMTNVPTSPTNVSNGVLTFPSNFQFTTTGTGTISVAATGVTTGTSTSITISTPVPILSITTPSAISSGGTYGFGNQVSGTSSSAITFTIQNTGSASMTIGAITLSGTNAGEFSVNTSGTASTLAVNATTTFTVTFSPTTDGAKTAAINIANNTSVNPFIINLTGTGTVSAASDITTAGNEQTDILYANYTSSTITATTDGLRLWSFTVRDGGATADADNRPTILSGVTIIQGASNTATPWNTYIKKAALFNGSTKVADLTVNATTMTVTGLSGANVTAPDGGSLTLDLYVTFNTASIIDRKQYQFMINSAGPTAAASGSSTFSAFTAIFSNNVSTANKVQVVASKLLFSTAPPSSGNVNTSLSTTPAVSAMDANNNVDIDFTFPGLSTTNSGGLGWSNLPATPTNVSNGVLTFPSNFQFTTTGTTTITVSATGVTPTTSSSIVINSAPYVLFDNFDRTASSTVGIPSSGGSTSWTETETTGSGGTGVQIFNNNLYLSNTNSGGGAIGNGNEQVVFDMSSKYTTTFNNAPNVYTWTFNLRMSRSSPSGFSTTNTYGAAVVLGTDQSSFTSASGSGYAVIIGNTGSPDPVKLIKYTGGLTANSNVTDVAVSSASTDADYYSVKVSFTPCNGQWALQVRDDGSSFADPTTISGSTTTVTATDQTYTGSNLKYSGVFFQHGASAGESVSVDNFYIPTTFAVGNTYTWNGGTGDYQVATNWTPSRTCPLPSDILKFTNTTNVTTNVPTQTVAQVLISAGASLTMRAATGATRTLTLQGGTGTDLDIPATASLSIDCDDPLQISLNTGVTASISGNFTFNNTIGSAGRDHRLLGTDASSITFNSGSVCTAQKLNGDPFGNTGTANTVVFASGSEYISRDGSSPFGLTQPSSKVVFNTGSLYSHEQSGAPSFPGRVYADFQFNYSGSNTITFGGNGTCTTDKLSVLQGTVSFPLTANNISQSFIVKGDLNVSSGASFSFNPTNSAAASTLTLGGSALQTITNNGTLTFGANSTLEIKNSSNVALASNVSTDGTLMLTTGLLNTGAKTFTVTSGGTTTRTSGWVNGTLIKGIGASTASKAFEIGDATKYDPITVTFTGTTNGAGSITATTVSGVSGQTQINNSGLNTAKSVDRIWNLTNTGVTSFTSADVTLQYNQTEILGGGNASNFYIRRFDGTNWTPNPDVTLAVNTLNSPSAGINTAKTSTSLNSASFTSGSTFNFVTGEKNTVSINCPSDITDHNGANICTATETFAATSPSSPSVTFTYTLGATNITSPYAFPVGAQSVVAAATNINGTATCSFNVTINNDILSNTPSNPTTCLGSNGSITLTGHLAPSTVYSVTYTKNGTPVAASNYTTDASGNLTVTGLRAATYDNFVVSNGTCSTAAYPAAGSITLSDPSSPVLGASSNSPVSITQTLLLVSNVVGGSPTYNFNWSGPSFTSTQQNPSRANATVAMSGTYNVTVTDGNSCTASATTNVVVNPTVTYTWTGATSTAWSVVTNWNPVAPTGGPNSCAHDVIIPLVTNQPVVSSSVSVGNIQINSGATLTLTGADLSACKTVTGSFSGATAIVTGTGNFIMNGSNAQTITGAAKFNRLRLNNSAGASMAVSSNVQIVTSLDLQSGNFDATNGTITFLSSSVTQAAILDNFSAGYTGTFSGSVKAQRFYLASQSYNQHFMGSPLNQIPFAQLAPSGTAGYLIPTANCDETQVAPSSPYSTVLALDETHGATCTAAEWVAITAGSGNMVNGKGYAVAKPGSGILTLTGAPNLSTTYSLSGLTNSGWNNTTLQGHNVTSGWHLISNPYLSSLSVSSLTAAGFDNQIQVWNANGPFAGTYQPYIAGVNAVIPPFGAFIVHKTVVGGTATMTLKAADRVRTASTFYSGGGVELVGVTVYNPRTQLSDQTFVGFDTLATDSFDPSFDANKPSGALNRQTLYTVCNNAWMALNFLHDVIQSPTVEMGLEPGTNDTFDMSFSNLSTFDPTTYVYVEDKFLGVMHNARNGDYIFHADSADAWARFRLHFTPPANFSTTDASCNTPGNISVTQPGPAVWNYTITNSNNDTVAVGTVDSLNPINAPVVAGTYTLTLVDTGGYTVTQPMIVGGPDAITADFSTPGSLVYVMDTVTLNSTSTNAISYVWDFGDGNIGSGQSVDHQYTGIGTYTVTLTVSNASGCSNSIAHDITINSHVVTTLNKIGATSNVTIWGSENNVLVDFTKMDKVDAVITIYNVLGQEISNEKFASNTIYTKQINNIEAAYMIVKVKDGDKTTVKKVFIRNTK